MKSTQLQPRTGRATILVALIAVIILYTSTLSRHYSADSLLYALVIESDRSDLLVDPTHLLLHPLGWFWYRMWILLGWSSGSLLPLQVLNVLGGASSVGLLYAIARRLSKVQDIAILTAAGFALSGGMWLLSVEAEFVTIPLAFSLLVLWLVLTPPSRIVKRPSYAVLLGLATVLAILSYLTSLFLVLVVLLGLALQPVYSPPLRRRQLMLFIGIVLLVLLPVALGLLIFRPLADWPQYLWQDGGSGYGQLSLFNLPHGAYAFLRTLLLFPGLALNDSTQAYLSQANFARRATFAGYYGLVFMLALLPVLAAVKIRHRLWANFGRELVILVLWSILYAAFGFFWVPGDITFWLPILVAWWLLVAMVTFSIISERSSGILSWPVRGQNTRIRVILITTILMIGALNAVLMILPRRDIQTNEAYNVANTVEKLTHEEDMIIVSDQDISAIYVAYFTDRHLVLVSEFPGSNRTMPQMLDIYADRVQASGGNIYLLNNGRLEQLND